MSRPFALVFICRGNRFRSPLAEAFVRSLTRGVNVSVESFGTLDVGNVPPLREASRIAVSCGVDVSRHLTRTVGSASLAEADLVLGFEQEHVRNAVVDGGAPVERSFTLQELVTLLEDLEFERSGDVVDDARRAVRAAAERRTSLAEIGEGQSIEDPFGRSWSHHMSVATDVRELSIELVRLLFGVTDTSALRPIPAHLGAAGPTDLMRRVSRRALRRHR